MGLGSFVAVAVGGLAAAAPTRLLAWGLPCAMSEALKRQKKKKKKKKRANLMQRKDLRVGGKPTNAGICHFTEHCDLPRCSHPHE